MPRGNQPLPNSSLDKFVLDKYMTLPLPEGSIHATYVWIDGTKKHLRCKTRIIASVPKTPEELPIWTYDGASTFQDHNTYSDIYLHPVAIYKDPFLCGNNILVLCETYYKYDDEPTEANKRKSCLEIVKKCVKADPWFGFEQEYCLLGMDERPFGWPAMGYPSPQGPYYCGVGTHFVFGRQVAQAHLRACLYAGIKIYGTNGERMASQWKFQVGPADGIKVADDLIMSRFILHRLSEEFGIMASLKPKPVAGNWHGSGCLTDVSTNVMRQPGGIIEIEKAISKLSKRHEKHIAVYDPEQGKDNALRLIGIFCTSPIGEFSSGIDTRQVSVRIPRSVADAGAGFFEDRRPSSNCDPYAVMEVILRTICLDE